jgi:hypothetical protein
MNTMQKVIKYAAITFAVLLTVGILTGIVGVVSGVVSIFNGEEGEMIDYSMDYNDDVEDLDISHGFGKLHVKIGTGFRVEATNVSENFSAKVVNGTLVIDESGFKRFLWFDFGISRKKSIITVYVPEDFNAKRIKVNSGAGEVNLENIAADYLIIDAGVGDIYGRSLTAKKVEVNGGVGNINLTDVNFSDVDFDSGVGNIKVEGMIFGRSDFDCGVGNVKLQLRGLREDYALRIDAGVGSIRINGDKISRDYNDNYKADNTISIDGGVGDVDIVFSH